MEQAARVISERKRAIGARIRDARVQKGWKQKDLAASVHVEPMTVSRWERGEHSPDVDMMGRIAAETGMPVAFFLPEPTPANGAVDRVAERLEDVVVALAEQVQLLRESNRELVDAARLLADTLSPAASPGRSRQAS